jgi:hypothetical protein
MLPTPHPALAQGSVTTRAPDLEQSPGRGAVLATAVAVGLVLAAQVPNAVDLLRPTTSSLSAARSKELLIVNAALAAITVVGALTLPRRLRWLALLPGAVVASATLGGAAILGGHAWDLAMGVLTMAAAWWAGRTLLRWLGVPALQEVFVVELVAGLGVTALVVFAIGRLDALSWWSVGALTIAAGAAGVWSASRMAWRRRNGLWSAIGRSRLGAACAGLLLLQLGWAVVWLSAPEIMFDALNGKAYLPQLWAQTGSIGPLLAHPILNVAGLAQVVAVPGDTVSAPAIGRVLQLLCWIVLVATVWWLGGRRSAAGPVAAVLVGVAPQIAWEATTAYDDLFLTVGAVGLAVAVMRTAGVGRIHRVEPTFGTAVAIGVLAGTCVWFKLNFIGLTLGLAGGWIVATGTWRGLVRRAVGVAIGAVAIAAPELVLRWIDTGNPVFPAYNAIFKSTHYPLVNEQYDFPYWPHAGLRDAVKLPYEAVMHPALVNPGTPAGTLGALVALILVALLIGWRRREGVATWVGWGGLVLGLLAWWVQFRYFRYLLPLAAMATILVLVQLRGWRAGRAATVVILATVAAASALFLPSTVASYWNVPRTNPPFGAAFGRWDSRDYLRVVFPDKPALDAFQRLSAPGADAVSSSHERTFLHDRDLSATWEVDRLLSIEGPPPTNGDDALRRLRALGIGWALVSGDDLTSTAYPWLHVVLARHGQVAFNGNGWALFRLVERPQRAHAR